MCIKLQVGLLGGGIGRIVMMYIVVKVRGEDNMPRPPLMYFTWTPSSGNASLLGGRLMGCDKRATLFATSCLPAGPDGNKQETRIFVLF